jgi:formylglycine-generating enzyme required for sulfatase activity
MTMTEKLAENSAHHVFISHARVKDDSTDFKINRKVVDIICSALKSEDINYWIDYQYIYGGDKLPEEIKKAIKKSKVMILIVSSEADKSKWVKREVYYADNLDLYIVPFSIREPCPEEDFEFFLSDRVWIYSSTTPSKSDLDKLIKAVRRHLEKKEPGKPADIIKKPPATAKEKIQESGEIPEDLPDVKLIAQRVYKNERGLWEADYGDGIIMVYIPAGEFIMGSNYYNNQKPLHTVYLDGYWMGKYEMTVKQFGIFIEDEGYITIAEKQGWSITNMTGEKWEREKIITWKNPGFKQDDNHPVVCISWDEAVKYCKWLSNKRGLSFKLPTEAQWEKAVRGTDGRKYPWGEQEPNDKLANFLNNIGKTTPVGSYPDGASPFGLLDMAGNVWEWCSDWYRIDYYKESSSKNPTGPDSGSKRVQRSGSWNYDTGYLRCAFRGKGTPDYPFNYVGFRLCKNISLKNIGSGKLFEKSEEKQNSKPDKAININRDSWAILFQKGKSLAALGLHNEALENLKKAEDIKPDSWAVLFQKGKSLDSLGLHNEALEALKKAEELNQQQDHPEALTQKGITTEKLPKEKESEEDKGNTMVEKKRDIGVFISYIRENEDKVNRLCEELRRSRVKVWKDKDNIKPGQYWKDVIRDAIKKGSFFIACFSKEFNERNRSHMHEELTLAIEELRKRPKDRAWFIPVLFSGEVPNLTISDGVTLRDIQWVDLSKDQDWDEGIDKILSVIEPTAR